MPDSQPFLFKKLNFGPRLYLGLLHPMELDTGLSLQFKSDYCTHRRVGICYSILDRCDIEPTKNIFYELEPRTNAWSEDILGRTKPNNCQLTYSLFSILSVIGKTDSYDWIDQVIDTDDTEYGYSTVDKYDFSFTYENKKYLSCVQLVNNIIAHDRTRLQYLLAR